MRSGPTVVIIGGGVIGLSTAFHLGRADPAARVIVVERASLGAAASGASAAGVRVMGRDPAERALALVSLARWPNLHRELEAATGYRRGGGLRVVLDDADWPTVMADVAAQQAAGVPLALVDPVAAREIVPGLTPDCAGAIHCPIDGQAEAMMVVQANAAAARRVGVQIIEGAEVLGLSSVAGRIDGILLADGERLACEVAIVAAGAWTAPLLAPLGVEAPLRARALQMLLTTPAAPGLGLVLGGVGQPLSLKQLPDGAYLIGGGWPAEIVDEGGNHWRLIEGSIEGNLAVARLIYPPLAAVDLARGWAGIEAFLPDELPLLGPVAGVAGLLVAAGFSGHGFALSPAIGDILARLALGGRALDHLWAGLRADRGWAAGSEGTGSPRSGLSSM